MFYENRVPTELDRAIFTNGHRTFLDRQHIMRYQFARSRIRTGDRVLDMACGTGYGSEYLGRSLNSSRVVGVDVSRNALQRANRHYRRENVDFCRGDGLRTPFPDDSFDTVVSFETLEHVDRPDGRRFLEEIRRLLKPSGQFLCSTPNIEYSSHPPYHDKEYSPGEFFELLGNFFSDVERFCQYERRSDRIRETFNRTCTSILRALVRRYPEQEPSQWPKHLFSTDVRDVQPEKNNGTSRKKETSVPHETSGGTDGHPVSGRRELDYIESDEEYDYEAVKPEDPRHEGIKRIMVGVCSP